MQQSTCCTKRSKENHFHLATCCTVYPSLKAVKPGNIVTCNMQLMWSIVHAACMTIAYSCYSQYNVALFMHGHGYLFNMQGMET